MPQGLCKRLHLILITFYLANGCSSRTPISMIDYPEYTVNQVLNPYTLEVTNSTGEILILRLACVDGNLPEPHDLNSNNYLRRYLDIVGNKIHVSITNTDTRGRIVGEVYIQDGGRIELLQERLVKEGKVFGNTKDKSDCPHYSLIESAEAIAKKKELGVWNKN